MNAISSKVGGWAILFAGSWLVPDGQDLEIDFIDPDGRPITAKLVFQADGGSLTANMVPFTNGNGLTINFVNWKEPFGSSTTKPITFWEDEKARLHFLANISFQAAFYNVRFQVMQETLS